MQDISWRHNYSTFELPLWMEKVEEEEKLQKIEYLENKKSFLREIKSVFIFLEGLSFGTI